MRFLSVFSVVAGCTLIAGAGCAVEFGGPVAGTPDRPDDVDLSAPDEAAPTGAKWAETDETDACGRTQRQWKLVDEVCYGTSAPDYLEHFRTPMFRDGVRIGEMLYSVDGTHIWAVDTETLARQSLGAYPGHPLAAAAHEGRLLVAAADGGLLMLDVGNLRPKIIDRLELDGPAMGIRVDGDVAWVAIGDGGIAAVELSKSGFVRHATTSLPAKSFAAAAQLDGRYAVVAACDRLAVIDPISGDVVGETWFESDMEIPARDVVVVRGVAFVAAGGAGAVSVDISDPQHPTITGNCTVEEDGYYASGVRTDGKHLYIAAGEWGVHVVDVRDPISACVGWTLPRQEAAQSCDAVPPWELVDWKVAYAPPPRSWDPIAVHVDGDRLFAFGDARRIGLRAVDVWDISGDLAFDALRGDTAIGLRKIGRYQEPHLVDRLTANTERVIITGEAAGIFRRLDDGMLAQMSTPHYLPEAAALKLLDDGRLLTLTHSGDVFIEGAVEPIASGIDALAPQIAQDAHGDVYVTSTRSLVRLDLTGAQEIVPLKHAALPASLAVHNGELVVAAPEWATARDLNDEPLEEGIFEEAEMLDVSAWRSGVPRRLLATSDLGLLELATLGTRASLMRHGGLAAMIDLPTGTYAAMAAHGGVAYVLAHDRGLYRSQLLVVELGADGPEVIRTQAFTGIATSLAVAGDNLYVGDADDGIVVFDLTEPRSPRQVALVALEARNASN